VSTALRFLLPVVWVAVLGARIAAAEPTKIAVDQAGSSDWPRWRGSAGAGQGGTQKFPHAWTEADWAWRVDLPGAGHSSPVVWQGKIYTASASRSGAESQAAQPAAATPGKRFVSCHLAVDGALLWQQEMLGPIEPHHLQNSSASGSVVTNETGVYWLWATQDNLRAEAFSHAGQRLWHADLGPYECEHGFGASATVWRDLLIVPIEQDGPSSVVALETQTGRTRWRLPRQTEKTAYSTPLVLPGDGLPQVVLASTSHGLTGIDPASGRVLWERRCFPRRTVSSPIRADGLVICTCGDGGGDNALVAVEIPTDKQLATTRLSTAAITAPPFEPKIVYQLDRSTAPYVPTPVCSGKRLYLWGDRGVVVCVAVADGSVIWKGRVGGMFSASPIVVGGTVLNVSADGEVVVIADGGAFEILGRSTLGQASRSTPAVVEGRMFFRSVGQLLALNCRGPLDPE